MLSLSFGCMDPDIIILIFLIGFWFLWIGAQLPQSKFISAGRFFILFLYSILIIYLIDVD